ncbi:hypothetical protein LSH36_427g01026 [Paralvinella palmiformis]|uniref:Uncharacterized protein n=1 Tax=Paralvinella palmiformis TaxID=53620 RepID=A0AAD9N0R5_9ANNE|nr:hypothetical protein LSH36_427g01026 [Paralvinella palmiformis]
MVFFFVKLFLAASDAELRQVTSAISCSFHQTGARPEGATGHHPSRQASPSEANVSSSHSSGVMEQLMEEMDQVFHDVLQGEDESRAGAGLTSTPLRSHSSDVRFTVGEDVPGSHRGGYYLLLGRKPTDRPSFVAGLDNTEPTDDNRPLFDGINVPL